MPEAFSFGPFVIPTLRVGTLLALVLASWFTARLAKQGNLAMNWVTTTNEWALWLGLAGARLGFVLQNWLAYQDTPWTALYLWQPGYSLVYGFIISGVYLLLRVWQRVQGNSLAYLWVFASGFVLSAVLTIGLTLSTKLDFSSESLRVGDLVPNFRLQNISGQTVELADFEGKVIVLNFWATWCPPCRREMPMLDAMNKVYADKDAIIIGIDVGESVQVVRRYIGEIGVSYQIWVDGPPNEGFDSTQVLLRQFGGVGLPTTVFIDSDGVIHSFKVGELSAGIVQSKIEAMLR